MLTIGKRTAVLYLWTEKGAWLLAKSLNTDQAWQACEMLVDDYYRRGEDIVALRQQVTILAQDNVTLHESCVAYLDVITKTVTMPGLSIEGIKHIESLGVGESLDRLRKAFFALEKQEENLKEHIPSAHRTLQALRKAVLDVCDCSVDADTELVMVSKRFLQQETIIAQLQSDMANLQLRGSEPPALLSQQGE